MTRRGGYVAALVVAVGALVGSVIAAVVFTTTSGPWSLHRASQGTAAGDWRTGLAGGGMMGSGTVSGDQSRGMMGRSGGGMMGNWDGNETASVTLAQAKTAADKWVAANQPGAAAGPGAQMPMGYVFTVTKDGQAIGMVMVNDDTGALSWVQYAQPTPAASAA